MPVIKVMERKSVEKARPWLSTLSQSRGIQVSMETMKSPRTTYHRTLITRPMAGVRTAAARGGSGGSTEASGSVA